MQDGLTSEYLSRMEGYATWTTLQTNIVRELVRQFVTSAVNLKSSREGKLFKHRRADQSNDTGRDPYTNEVIDTEYATYAEDTYEEGINLYIRVLKLRTDIEELEYPQGIQENSVMTGATVCAPNIESGDLWKDNTTGEVFYLRPVGYIAEVQAIPVIAQVQMYKLPETHPQYNLS